MGSMNPVLEEYITGIQLRRQAEDLALRRQKLAHESEEFGKQYEESKRQFDEQMRAQREKLKLSHALQQAQFGVQSALLKQQTLGNIGAGTTKFAPTSYLPRGSFGEDVGYDINNLRPGPAVQEVTPSVEGYPGVSIRSDEVQTPQERGQAAFEVQKPLLEFKGKEALDLALGKFGAQSALQTQLQKQKDVAALERNNATIEGRKAVANISANARRYAADKSTGAAMKASMADLGDVAMLGATGQGDISGFTDKAILARRVLKDNGYVEFKSKEAEKLKAIHDVDELYNFMEGFIQRQGLPKSTGGAIGQLIASKIPGTNTKNFRDKIRGMAANVSHTYGGEIGRLSDPDVERAIGLLVTPGITQEQALQRLTAFRAETKNKVMNHILGGQGPKQKLVNIRTYNFNPAEFNIPVTVGKDKYRSFQQDPDGEWRYFDPKTKTYNTLD